MCPRFIARVNGYWGIVNQQQNICLNFFFFFEELRRRERVSEGQQIYFQFSRRKEGRFPRMAACTWILKLYLCEVLENTAKEMISEHFGKETTHP